MKRMIILLAVALFLPGCGDTSTAPVNSDKYYESDLSIPENLLKNLVTSYERREIDQYSKLLAQDFTFKFQPGPGADTFPDGLSLAQDVLFTGNMFKSDDVVEIRLGMIWGLPHDQIWLGEQVSRIQLIDLHLDVEKTGSLILRVVGDPQDFYFRLGKETLGEDPSRYYIVGWQDVGSPSAPAGLSPAVESITWGSIKRLFQRT